jgi:hypothetical protein
MTDRHLGIPYMVLGGLQFAWAIVELHATVSFQNVSKRTGGEVIDPGEGKPIVEWVDPLGQRHLFRVGMDSEETFLYANGEKVTVRYVPSDPSGARLDTFRENWALPVFLGVSGSFFAGLGWWLRRKGD